MGAYERLVSKLGSEETKPQGAFGRLTERLAQEETVESTPRVISRAPMYDNAARKADRQNNRLSAPTVDMVEPTSEKSVDERIAELTKEYNGLQFGFPVGGTSEQKAAWGTRLNEVKTELDELRGYKSTVGKALTGAGKSWLGSLLGGGAAVVDSTGGTQATSVYEDELADIQKRREYLIADMNRPDLTPDERAEQEWQLNQYDERIKVLSDAVRANEQTGEAAYKASSELIESGAQDVEAAKQGKGKVGQFLIDTGVAGAQMAADALAAAGTMGAVNPLVTAAVRGGGGKAVEARNDGKSAQEALTRGVAEAAKTWAIGKLFSGSTLSKKYAGAGAADDFVDNIASRFANRVAKSEGGQNALAGLFKFVSSGVGEGVEELLEKIADPVLDAVVYRNVDELKEYGTAEYWGDALYESLVGAAMGFASGGVDAVTGKYAPNAQNAPTSELNGAQDAFVDTEVNNPTEQASAPVEPVAAEAEITNVNVRNAISSAEQNGGRVSNSRADAVLRDADALAELGIAEDAIKGKTASEQRQIVRDAVSGVTAEAANALPEGLGAMSGENPTDAKPSKVGTNTLTNTPYLTAEQKQRYKPETLTYESTTNAKDMLAASERLALDYNGEADAITQEGVKNAEDLHVAFALMFDAVQKDGETGTSARQWMEKLVEAGSVGGQVVQAFSVYAHTPEGKLVEAQRAIDAINDGVSVDPGERGVTSEASEAKKKQGGKQRKAAADKEAEEVLSEIDKPTSKSGKRGKTHRKAAKQASKDIIRGVVKGNTTAEMWSDIASDKMATRKERADGKQKTTPQIIMEDLVRFAATNVTAEVTRGGRTNAERVADYLANTPFYDEVWQTAKRKIREQYADDPEALAEFDRYLNHSLRESVLNTVYEAEHVARLSDNEITEVFELMQKSNAAEAGSYEANMYEAKANQIIASKLPKTFRNKLVSALMGNMLGNIRTLLTRNAGGNLLTALPEQVSKGFATGVDALVGLATGERAHMVTPGYYKAYAQGFAKGAKDATRDFANRVKTPRSGESLDYSAQFDPFDSKVSSLSNRLIQYGLDVGDRPFYEANYAARMKELERIRSRNKLGPEMAANFDALAPLVAQAYALDSVYQSKGKTAQGLSEIKSAIQNLIQGTTGISLGGQFSVPFTRTPGGMLERTAEYLPVLGTVKNAITTGKELARGEFNQARFSMESGRNLTGLLAAGASVGGVLAGLITGGSYGDDDEKTKEQSGWQEYSIKIGDKYYSYDWIPILGSVMGGVADAVDAFQNAESGSNAFLKGVGAGLGTVTEMSAMQGLNRMFGGYNSTVQGFGNMLLEGTSQLVPSLVRQAASATDEYARQTYDPNIIVRQWNKIRASVPVLRETLPVLYDMYGNPVEQNQGRGVVSKLAENMLSPGTYSESEYDPRNNILLRIAEEGFGTDPSATPKKVKDLTLSAEEYNQYSKTSGESFGEIMDAFVGNERFDALPIAVQSLVVNAAQEYAADEAKREFMMGRGEAYESEWDDEAGLSPTALAEKLIYDKALTAVKKDEVASESYTAMDALLDTASGMNKQALAVMEDKPLFTRLLDAADADISSEQFMNTYNAIKELGEKAKFHEKANVVLSRTDLNDEQKWHMLYDTKGGASGDRDKVNTAKAVGIPIALFVDAAARLDGVSKSDDVIAILNGMIASNAEKSKLYALYTTTKKSGGKNPFGNDYSDTLAWKTIP